MLKQEIQHIILATMPTKTSYSTLKDVTCQSFPEPLHAVQELFPKPVNQFSRKYPSSGMKTDIRSPVALFTLKPVKRQA